MHIFLPFNDMRNMLPKGKHLFVEFWGYRQSWSSTFMFHLTSERYKEHRITCIVPFACACAARSCEKEQGKKGGTHFLCHQTCHGGTG